MGSLKIPIMILTIVLIAFVIFLAIVKYLLDRDEGYQRFQKCEQVRSKISREELMSMIGQPYRIEKTQSGSVYYYREAMFAAGPIRWMLDTHENMAIGTKCSEDGEWKYFE